MNTAVTLTAMGRERDGHHLATRRGVDGVRSARVGAANEERGWGEKRCSCGHRQGGSEGTPH